MLGKNLIQAATGAAGGDVLGVEDVFSTWLYTGNGSTQTITNGIDLAGEGGLVWLKKRSASAANYLADTVRGTTKTLRTNSTSAEATNSVPFNSFNSDGFTIGADSEINSVLGDTMASWTFRKAPKFFDVVTFTSSGASSQQIAHNLGSVPGFIILKNLNSASYGWYMYHREMDASVPEQYGIEFTTAARNNNSGFWNNTQPTSTHFTIGNLYQGNTQNYVAYLFAHDAGGFGDSGDESVVKCGSFSGTGFVNLGWEPQFILFKRTDSTSNWFMIDNMRGFSQTSGRALYSNLANAEADALGSFFPPSATGFTNNAYTGSWIYIAIRRGPMKTPTDATEVFNAVFQDGTDPNYEPGFVTDAGIRYFKPGGAGPHFASRLTGANWIQTSSTAAEASNTNIAWDYMTGWYKNASASSDVITHNFRRAPGFFDVVAYTGTGVARTVPHNLGVAPELMIVKSRSNSNDWIVYHSSVAIQNILKLQSTAAATDFGSPGAWNNTAPTASVFTVSGTGWSVNNSGWTHISYLFASCPGVSKVGSYTGTGTTLNIDCGFAAGARFVMIKRTDSTGDWYVWDTARGIVSGNDPYLLINSTAAEVTSTDYIDPLASGFQITSTAPAAINASGGSFIFLAVA